MKLIIVLHYYIFETSSKKCGPHTYKLHFCKLVECILHSHKNQHDQPLLFYQNIQRPYESHPQIAHPMDPASTDHLALRKTEELDPTLQKNFLWLTQIFVYVFTKFVLRTCYASERNSKQPFEMITSKAGYVGTQTKTDYVYCIRFDTLMVDETGSKNRYALTHVPCIQKCCDVTRQRRQKWPID